ncbi:hypothetical protein ABBQ38_012302 [Trebouxia sp. C0009 RCD-2024]
MSRTVLVTVGTTKFDALVQAVDSLNVAATLVARGYTRLVIQKGAGKHQVQTLVPVGSQHHQLSNGLQVEVFDFAPSLAEYMQAADLIISHAGSGSIFEALRLKKPLIAVPNPVLMDNHQAELADHLARLHYIIAAKPHTLLHTLQHLSVDDLQPYTSGSAEGIIQHINMVVAQPSRSKLPLLTLTVLMLVVSVAIMYLTVRAMTWTAHPESVVQV